MQYYEINVMLSRPAGISIPICCLETLIRPTGTG